MIINEFGYFDRPLGKSFCEIAFTVPMAIAAAGGLQAGGSILSGLFGASAAEEQAEAAKEIARMQIAATERAEGRAVERLEPFAAPGREAVGTLRDVFLGGPSSAGAKSLTQFVEGSPAFNVLGEFGEEAINRDLSARGLFGSGAGVEALSDFRRRLLVDVANQFLGGTESLARIGQSSAALTADAAARTGSLTVGSLSELGNRLTSSIGARGQSFSNIATGVAGAGTSALSTFIGQQQFDKIISGLNRGSGGGTPFSLANFAPSGSGFGVFRQPSSLSTLGIDMRSF